MGALSAAQRGARARQPCRGVGAVGAHGRGRGRAEAADGARAAASALDARVAESERSLRAELAQARGLATSRRDEGGARRVGVGARARGRRGAQDEGGRAARSDLRVRRPPQPQPARVPGGGGGAARGGGARGPRGGGGIGGASRRRGGARRAGGGDGDGALDDGGGARGRGRRAPERREQPRGGAEAARDDACDAGVAAGRGRGGVTLRALSQAARHPRPHGRAAAGRHVCGVAARRRAARRSGGSRGSRRGRGDGGAAGARGARGQPRARRARKPRNGQRRSRRRRWRRCAPRPSAR